MSSIHLELLDKNKLLIFEKLQIFKKEAVLAGGTALFLQIAHRQSLDFDLFLPREIDRKDYLKIRKTFGVKEVKLNIANQLTLITPADVKITLVFYPFQSLLPLVATPSIPLFSVSDIAADKVYTIGRRAVWRDYVDIFFLLKEKYLLLEEIITLAIKKFGPEFNPKLFLEQLVYFDDLEITPTEFIQKKYSEKEIKDLLSKEVRSFLKKQIPQIG